MDYVILQSFRRADLAASVKTYAKDGWLCQGGVSAIYSPAEGVCLFQAMTKPQA